MESVPAVGTVITKSSSELGSESNVAATLSSDISSVKLKTVSSEAPINLLAVHSQNKQFFLQQPLKVVSNGPGLVTNGAALSKSHIILKQKPAVVNQQTNMPAAAAAAASLLGDVVTLERSGVKRPLTSSGSNVVTKVIITKNSLSGQPQVFPAGGASQTIRLASLPSGSIFNGINAGSRQQGSLSFIQPTAASTDAFSPAQAVLGTNSVAVTPKINVPVQKIPSSPVKTPTKITMIPMSGSASRQTLNSSVTVLSHVANSLAQTESVALKPGSPSKVIIKQASAPTGSSALAVRGQLLPALAPQTANPVRVSSMVQGSKTLQLSHNVVPVSVTSGGLVQQIQVPGSRFHYVRLVSHPSNAESSTLTGATAVKPSVGEITQVPQVTINVAAPTSASTAVNSGQVKIAVPSFQQQNTPLAPKPAVIPVSVGTQQSVHRIILPATSSSVSTQGSAVTSLVPIQPAPSLSVPIVNQLPAGTTILPASNLQGLQSFALVPASYVTQFQQQLNRPPVAQPGATPPPSASSSSLPKQARDYVPIASIDPAVTQYTVSRNAPTPNGSTLEATGARPRKPCNCTKSQCLKLYCDCFANGEFCQSCNCTNCANNLEHEEERSKAIKSCLDRNPQAFHPKIGKSKEIEGSRRHTKGCNCKRSGCLKNYCECYEAKIMCSNYCKCIGCKNFEESPERKTLMHLADAAEVRVQQQTAAKTKLSSQISCVPSRPPVATASGERLPFALITSDVAEATSACLLAQAEEAERMKMPPVVQERMIIEEFGRCLMQIIDSANRTRAVASSLA